MKNATKYADSLHTLLKRVRKEHPPTEREHLEPLQALVRGAMSYDVADSRAEEAMKAIAREFVDLNELRVATDLEIQELLGTKYPDIEKRVAMITGALNNIFEREHTMNLERLKTISKRDARQFIRELPGIHPFVEAYVMLFGFDGHAFPVDETVVEQLREAHAIEESATLEEVQKFVEHNLKADETHDLYVGLRAAVHGGKKKK